MFRQQPAAKNCLLLFLSRAEQFHCVHGRSPDSAHSKCEKTSASVQLSSDQSMPLVLGLRPRNDRHMSKVHVFSLTPFLSLHCKRHPFVHMTAAVSLMRQTGRCFWHFLVSPVAVAATRCWQLLRRGRGYFCRTRRGTRFGQL